jgi:hypothetical protein
MLTADILTLSWQMLGLKSLWDNKNNNNNDLFEKKNKIKVAHFCAEPPQGMPKKVQKDKPKLRVGEYIACLSCWCGV